MDVSQVSSFLDALAGMFSSDGFVPRRLCGLWPEWLVWEHIAGNALVWLAYIAVPLMIWRLGTRWPKSSPFRTISRAFILFIALCGLGHFLDMLSFFYPMYRLSGHILVATGIVSWWTAWSLSGAWPALMAMKSPAELESVIAERTEALRASEHRFRALTEALPQLIWITGPDGACEYASPQWFSYTGVRDCLELTARWHEILHPDDAPRVDALWAETLESGDSYDTEYRMRRRDGAYCWFKARGVPIRQADGRIAHWFGTCTDVDDQKRAEEREWELQVRFRMIFEAMDEGFCVVEVQFDEHGRPTDYRFLEVNPAFEKQTGIKDAKGRSMRQIAPDHEQHWFDNFGRIALTGETLRFENQAAALHRWYDVCAFRVGPAELRRVGILFNDISARKRAEEAIRASERIYRAIGESIAYGVWICDPEGRNTYASESFLRLVGMTQEQCSEFGWGNAMHPDDAERALAAWKECVRAEGTWDFEPLFRGTDGEWHPILARGVPVRDEDGRIVCWAGINLDISRLKQAEQALRRSEERQRLALSAARIAHWEWDIPGDRIPYQDSLSRLYDRPDDRPFADFPDYLSIVHPDDLAAVRDAAERALSPGVPYEVDYRIVWSDGSVRWIAGRGGTFFGEDGTPLRMVGVNLDITDRKESEAQIRRLNDGLEQRVRERTAELAAANASIREEGLRFRAIFESMFQFIGLLAPDGTLLEANRTALDFAGIALGDVVGRPFWEARWWTLSTETQDRLRQAIRDAAAGQFVRYEVDVRGAGDVFATIDFSLKPIRDEADRVVLLIPEGRVITEQKRAAEALRRSDAALRESQRLAGVGSWQWDPIADVVTWSDELYRIAGRDPSLPAPKYVEHVELYTPESLARHGAAVAAALETGQPYEIELEMIGRDGVNRWIIARGEAVRDPDGRIVMLRGTAQDVTARKRFEEDLRRARDEAMAATRAKSEFLANMSHEIRTPMNGVLGMTDLLLDTQLNDLQRDYAQTIWASGEALLTVINDILDFSKIEAGKLTLGSTEFDLRTLMEEVADLLSPRAHQQNLQIVCRVAREVPGRVIGDPVRVRQVLTNLAGNAVKFTERGKVELQAKLIAEDGDKATVRILVSDTGVGIPAERQADIFESFTQIDGGNRRQHGGTGLGLAICRGLVSLMGGRIGVESCPGQGSTFWFEVPLAKGGAAADAPATQLADLRMLVADGDEMNRAILREMLLSWECRPEVVASSAEALGKLLASPDKDPFQLILLDQDLPGMDGEQTARVIKASPHFAEVPLVLLNSLSSPGADEVEDVLWAVRMTKPVRRSQLYDTVCRAIATAASPRVQRPPKDVVGIKLSSTVRILLAEDNDVNRRVAIGIAERLGCEVEAVRNGREALAALDYGRHDLVLMDVQMPEMDGLTATAAIRERERSTGRHIPIIAMTAHAMQGDRERCLAAGMDGYMSKPIRPGTLRDALRDHAARDERP